VPKPIFISYRRDDSEGESGRLFDDLVRAFGNDNVFMDVAGIKPGADFRKAIEDNVANCGVQLAMIGPTWITVANANGERRLDDPNDFVALEISSALKRGVPVIPVLIHNARMPKPEQLPEAIRELAYRNSVELTHARWNSDVQLLIQALDSYVTPNKATVKDPVHATVSVQLPAPQPARVPSAAKSKKPAILIVAAVVVIALIVILYFIGGPAPMASNNSSANFNSAASPAAAPAANSAATPADADVSPSISTFIGTWKDPSPRAAGNSLSSLVITGSGSTLTIHALANCDSGPCDWGTQTATVQGRTATATFAPNANDPSETRQAQVAVTLGEGGVDVTVHNTFTGSDGAHTNDLHRHFVAVL
jgi:hypothetical protein